MAKPVVGRSEETMRSAQHTHDQSGSGTDGTHSSDPVNLRCDLNRNLCLNPSIREVLE